VRVKVGGSIKGVRDCLHNYVSWDDILQCISTLGRWKRGRRIQQHIRPRLKIRWLSTGLNFRELF
jgi:hypothetical protein